MTLLAVLIFFFVAVVLDCALPPRWSITKGALGPLDRWAAGDKRLIPTAEVDEACMRWWLRNNEATFGQLPALNVQDAWCLAHPWADGSPTAGAIARLRRDWFNEAPEDSMEPLDAARFERLLDALVVDKARFDHEQHPAQQIDRAVTTTNQWRNAERFLDKHGPAETIRRYERVCRNDGPPLWAAALAEALRAHPDVTRVQFMDGQPNQFVYSGPFHAGGTCSIRR